MARPIRRWVSDGLYHITARGNNRQPIFLDDIDYQQYLLQLREHQQDIPYRLVAYALMPNHVHLVIQIVREASFSEVMQRVAAGYTRYFNERYSRVGHLYQGRFYSNFIHREAYAREVTRYVHLNPVRAGLCVWPGEYAWSSYQVYVTGVPDPLNLVEPSALLTLFGHTPTAQRVQYRRFVEDLLDQEPTFRVSVQWLRREKLIPPTRWLKEKVSDTSAALRSV